MKTKLWLIVTLTIVLALLLAACGPAAVATPGAGGFKFALVTPNPRGDRSFIDASIRGVERANAELPVQGTIVEAQSVADQESAMRSAIAQGNDIVLGLAIEPDTLLGLAEEFPDQKFGVPSDIFVDDLPDNVAAFQINVHEGSFLAGLVAGKLTQTKTVGAVVGGDAPGLNQFFYAYKQGVLEVCPDCNVLVSYLGFEFSNPTLGKETALGQFEQGADIVFQVAGRSGEGVISAAQERGLYAIGVDSNQDDLAPGHVIVSMMKRVDSSTFLLVKNTLEGNFTPGFSVIGMADGATGLSWDEGSTTFADQGPAELTGQLPEVRAVVEDYRGRILGGQYEVCDALNETAVCAPLK
jgi:basic membrane protein A and related proteins